MCYSCQSRLIIHFDPNIILIELSNNELYISYHVTQLIIGWCLNMFLNTIIIRVMFGLINVEGYLKFDTT